MDKPAAPLNIILQRTFSIAAPITVPKSNFQFLFHAAMIRITKKIGTNMLISILGVVHKPFRYSISYERNDTTCGLLSIGAGNQNMLVNNANIDANIPVNFLLKAKTTIGIINNGLIYQLKTLWCLSNAQLKKGSFVKNSNRNTTVEAANIIPNIKSIFLFILVEAPFKKLNINYISTDKQNVLF